MSGSNKAITERARLVGALGEVRGMLLRELTEMRRELKDKTEALRTTTARLEYVRRQVAFQRARRDRIMGKKRGPA